MTNQKPRPLSAYLESVPTFRAEKNHIVAVFPIGPDSTIGIRFESPEQLMTFFVEMMEKATQVWPNHPVIKDYLE